MFRKETAKDPSISAERRRYLQYRHREKQLISFSRWGILLGLIGLWELGAQLGWIDSFMMSQPSRILRTFMNLAENQLLLHLSVTLYETLAGFFIGAVGGVLLAVCLWWSNLLSRIFEPFLVVLNSLPKIALGPVIIIWVGRCV